MLVLLFSASAARAAVPSSTHNFRILSKTDTVPNNDIGHAGSPACDGKKSRCNIDALKMVCLNNVKCTGFNTDGWLYVADHVADHFPALLSLIGCT